MMDTTNKSKARPLLMYIAHYDGKIFISKLQVHSFHEPLTGRRTATLMNHVCVKRQHMRHK